MKRIVIPATLAFAAAALSACNDGNVTARARGKITPQNSQQVGEAISSTVSGSLGGVSGSGSSTGSSKLHASKFKGSGSAATKLKSVNLLASTGSHVHAFDGGTAPSCYTVSGDQSDADNDGIPADATYTLTDCSDSYDGWTEDWNGTEEIKDTKPNDATYDYGLSFNLAATFAQGCSAIESDQISGSESGAQDGNTFTFVDNEQDAYTGTYQGQDYSGNFADDLTYVFAASNADLTAGTYTVNGTWSENFDGQAVDTTVTTPDPMMIDPGCDSGIVSGTVVAASGDSSVTMTWSGCDQETITYSGPQAGS
ncbi:MAG TPA: hypothetical protein VMV18_12585 [bacterium]|nr:hypothetical protein [bacterium]